MPNDPPPAARPTPGPAATAAQVRYILGLCKRQRRAVDYARMRTVREASEYIDHLVESGY
eukprot:7623847-Alexandrium_andersonii.AAC.1